MKILAHVNDLQKKKKKNNVNDLQKKKKKKQFTVPNVGLGYTLAIANVSAIYTLVIANVFPYTTLVNVFFFHDYSLTTFTTQPSQKNKKLKTNVSAIYTLVIANVFPYTTLVNVFFSIIKLHFLTWV
jgi:uncharacterized protein YqiB (DUF1249 family)